MTDSLSKLLDTGELDACARPASQAHSLPPACYRDPAIAEAEVDRLFRRGWIGIGRADQVAGPGDYRTLDLAGTPVILLRDRAGRLRAFANTCRHRGARLLDGAGTCNGIRCPFHSWFYGLDGTLVRAPEMDRAEQFDKADHGLVEYRAEERLGFAFLSFDPNVEPLDTYLGDFAAIHAPWPFETLVTTRQRRLEVDCNWKAFLEVFNEYYHLPFVHPDSIDDVYAPPDPADEVAGAFATQFGSTEGTGGLLQSQQDAVLPAMPGLKGREENGVRYTWVFPNMTFAAGRDALWVYQAYPLGPDRCQVFQTACFPPETVASEGFTQKAALYHDRLDAALDEDIPALVNQQRGLASPDARPGRFQPDLEPNVAAFASWYAKALTQT